MENNPTRTCGTRANIQWVAALQGLHDYYYFTGGSALCVATLAYAVYFARLWWQAIGRLLALLFSDSDIKTRLLYRPCPFICSGKTCENNVRSEDYHEVLSKRTCQALYFLTFVEPSMAPENSG